MLSRVGRAQGFLCLFLFMPFNSNGLQKLAVEPNPGTEPSMHKNGWRVQSVFDGRNSHAMTESTSCREAAQSNEITSLDAAMTLVLHIEHSWRGASEFLPWAALRV